MAKDKKQSKQADLFGAQPAPPPKSKRVTWGERMARALNAETPAEAVHAPLDLQLLARICKVLSEETADGVFKLGSVKASEILTTRADPAVWKPGAAALRDLEMLGVVERVSFGAPGASSTWKYTGTGGEAAPVDPALPPWLMDAMPANHRCGSWAAAAAWN